MIMPKNKNKSEENKTSHTPKPDKNLCTRREFIGTIAGIGAIGLIGGAAKKPKDKKSETPVWTGDLKTTKKPTPQTAKRNGGFDWVCFPVVRRRGLFS